MCGGIGSEIYEFLRNCWFPCDRLRKIFPSCPRYSFLMLRIVLHCSSHNLFQDILLFDCLYGTLLYIIITFSSMSEFTVAISEPRDLTSWGVTDNFCSILELDCYGAAIGASAWVQMQLDFALQLSIHFITPANHIECCNGWVMRDLFSICRASIDPHLRCLSDDGIETFFLRKIQQRKRYGKNGSKLKPTQRI